MNQMTQAKIEPSLLSPSLHRVRISTTALGYEYKARQVMNQFAFFKRSKLEKYETASNLFILAAQKFKVCQQYEDAIRCYLDAAHAYRKVQDAENAEGQILNAACCCKLNQDYDRLESFCTTLSYSKHEHIILALARLCQEVGEDFASRNNSEQATNWLQKAFIYSTMSSQNDRPAIENVQLKDSGYEYSSGIRLAVINDQLTSPRKAS